MSLLCVVFARFALPICNLCRFVYSVLCVVMQSSANHPFAKKRRPKFGRLCDLLKFFFQSGNLDEVCANTRAKRKTGCDNDVVARFCKSHAVNSFFGVL